MFRIAISLVQGLRGKCEAIQYWIQSIRALQPQNITCSQQKIFSIYKPYHRSSTSLYSSTQASLVGVSVSLGFFLTSFNVPLPNEVYTVLHPFYIHLHPFTSIYYIVYTCCFCSLEVTSTKTIPVVWWHLKINHGIPVGAPLDSTALTSSSTWCVGERSSSSSPSESWGSWEFFSGEQVTSVFLKAELVF